MTITASGRASGSTSRQAAAAALLQAGRGLRGKAATFGFLFVSPEHDLKAALDEARLQMPMTDFVILDGNRKDLVAAARRAATEARERLGSKRAAGILLFDCICRGAILGAEFSAEIGAVRDVFPDVPIAGFLTYGEIARYSGKLDGWHNTTAVVVAIPA